MDPYDDFLDFLPSFDPNIPPAYPLGLARVVDVSLLPPGESVADFVESFRQLSSMEATQANTPSSFHGTPNTLGYPRDLPHVVDNEFLFPEHEPAEGPAEDSTKRVEQLPSDGVARAIVPTSSGEASPTDYKKRPHSPDCNTVKRVKGNGGSRFKSEDERRETRNTREKGACLSCQNSKRRCIDGPDPKGPCARCLQRNMKLGAPLCFRPKIRDIEVFRRGRMSKSCLSSLRLADSANDEGPTLNFAWSRRWKSRDVKPDAKSIWKPITELPTGRSDRFKTVELSQGHGPGNLRLRVREYNPEPDDRQYYTWHDGNREHIYSTTAYAIADLGYARSAIKKFLDRNFKIYLDVLLRNSSPITKHTFDAALQNQDLTLLEPTLRLWVASRFIETPWHISGSETLGMSKDAHANSPYREWIPQTPIMDFQLDNLVIHSTLQPLLKEILNTLRTKTLANRKEDWLELQLTHFILLNTIELTMAHDIEFARRYRIEGSRWSNRPLIEMVTQGANTLLTYFHNANNGHYPFSAPWLEVERSHQWSEEQKTYITEIRKLLGQQRDAATEPAMEMFWTGQLHRAEWNAVSVSV